ncbi:MAG TPA: hypothetical protein VMZ27_18280 [Candidatus Saccharimonadales bacterium]|nr:hypothetical protein [Candidatus Saccharimonadales bacterium]
MLAARAIWLRTDPARPTEPTSQLLPKRWDGSYEAGEDLLLRLCGFMQVDPKRLHLAFYSKSDSHEEDSAFGGEWQSSGPAGLYHDPKGQKKLVIALEKSGLLRPASLAATICDELAHVHLLADQRIKRDEEDCEPLTDLLKVYFGAGILSANSAFQFNQWQDGRMQGWNMSRQGYLSEAQFGFSLACFAWFRGEAKPEWGKYLRENIAYYFDDSMHFLSTTRDSSIPFDGA